MSTRCNVKMTDGHDTLWFYRHSDGYPEGALPELVKFMKWVKDGKLRDNVEQASGWLILLGAKEYDVPLPNGLPIGWKCGAWEPATGEHGDIEYLYELDLDAKTIKYEETIYNDDDDTEETKEIVIDNFDKEQLKLLLGV